MITQEIICYKIIVTANNNLATEKDIAIKSPSEIESDVTVLLVFHSINQIRELCNGAIWLENGKIKMTGSSNDVCDEYEKFMK